jgi:adenine C2-methylase RlmN of 23S rRNA A2503 and tRNA A37
MTEEERSATPTLVKLDHHTRCGDCKLNVALCGTPLAGASESYDPAPSGSLCVVCFSGAALTCSNCGTEREGVTS